MPHGNANPISEKNIVPEFTCIYVDISLLKKKKITIANESYQKTVC